MKTSYLKRWGAMTFIPNHTTGSLIMKCAFFLQDLMHAACVGLLKVWLVSAESAVTDDRESRSF